MPMVRTALNTAIAMRARRSTKGKLLITAAAPSAFIRNGAFVMPHQRQHRRQIPAADCKTPVVMAILLAVKRKDIIVVRTAEAGGSVLSVQTTATALRVGPVILEHADQLRSLLMSQAMASR